MDNIEFQNEKENLHNVIEKYKDIMEYYGGNIPEV